MAMNDCKAVALDGGDQSRNLVKLALMEKDILQMVQIQVMFVEVVLKDNGQHMHLNRILNILHNHIIQMKMKRISWMVKCIQLCQRY